MCIHTFACLIIKQYSTGLFVSYSRKKNNCMKQGQTKTNFYFDGLSLGGLKNRQKYLLSNFKRKRNYQVANQKLGRKSLKPPRLFGSRSRLDRLTQATFLETVKTLFRYEEKCPTSKKSTCQKVNPNKMAKWRSVEWKILCHLAQKSIGQTSFGRKSIGPIPSPNLAPTLSTDGNISWGLA